MYMYEEEYGRCRYNLMLVLVFEAWIRTYLVRPYHTPCFFIACCCNVLVHTLTKSPTRHQVDIVPTMMDLCDISTDNYVLDGRSLVPLLTTAEREDRVAFSTLYRWRYVFLVFLERNMYCAASLA